MDQDSDGTSKYIHTFDPKQSQLAEWAVRMLNGFFRFKRKGWDR